MTPAAFATWILLHIDRDTWFTAATLQRRLAGINGQQFTASRLLMALLKAGWTEAHPSQPDCYNLPAQCWLPKPKTNYISLR